MGGVDDEEEVLNLTLAIVTARSSCGEDERETKLRKRRSEGDEEWKILMLLEKRDQMVKRDYQRKELVNEPGKGLHLIHLLLISATAIDQNNTDLALKNLIQLYGLVSLTNDSIHRVVSYFADGLAAKILTRRSPFFYLLLKNPSEEEDFSAYTDLYRVSPYFQFAHFTANQAIIEAFDKEEEKNNRALHIIDYDISYGFQWPSLLQSLSEKAINGGQIFLKITGFGRTVEELKETGNRLVNFSKGLRNLSFEFEGLLRGSKIINLKKRENETVAVNLFFHFSSSKTSLANISETLKTVHSFKPSTIVLVEQEGCSCRGQKSFISTFMESLHHFAAMFDSLDDCLPRDSSERLNIEKNNLGKEIKGMLNSDGFETKRERVNEKEETWKCLMESHGYEGIKVSSKSVLQAKLLLKMRSHNCSPLQFDEEKGGGFRVSERDDGLALSLRWQDRNLLTASAWKCSSQ